MRLDSQNRTLNKAATISFLVCLLIPAISFSQIDRTISGKIPHVSNDTLIIYPDHGIPDKFYEIEKDNFRIENEEFKANLEISYPQLLYTIFSSDEGYVLNRPKSFFVDKTSTAIFIDTSDWEQSYVKGDVGSEYEEEFKPFVNDQKTKDDNYSFYSLPFLRNVTVDTLLFNYSKLNPDSFIPLWFLIKRYYQYGHSQLRENHLKLFSDRVKQSKIWNLLNEDINNAPLKEGKVFPPMQLVDPKLQPYSLTDNTGKYFLLDFWFTSCKPCLAALPQLNEIYNKFNSSGLEVISISVDRDPTVEKWMKRIQEDDMPWKHSLDLNGVGSSKLFVKNFPRYILVNKDWEVINTDITLDKLEVYLTENLK